MAHDVAAEVWAERATFLTRLTPLTDAVALAVEAGRRGPDGAFGAERLILADVADNPGGGGGGNTTALLRALLGAGARHAMLGVFTDPALAAEAHARGVGAVFDARFNRDAARAACADPSADPSPEPSSDAFAEPFTHAARVLALADGAFVGRKGLVAGSAQSMGSSALLELDGVRVLVISLRQQLLDPAQLEALGIDLARAEPAVRTLVVKSRGHFRAAFDDFAPPARIVEVDGPGLTTPKLATLPLARVPRPVFPLDADTRWPPS